MHRVQCVHVVYSVPIRFEDRLARIQLEIIYILLTYIGKLSTCLQLHDVWLYSVCQMVYGRQGEDVHAKGRREGWMGNL